MNGFIMLSRKILESEVFASENLLKVWIWCLCRANHKENFISITGFNTIKVKRGQFIFGRKTASAELRMNESLVYRCVKRLQVLKNIDIKSNNKYSIITICNYDKYQDSKFYTEQQVNNKRTTSEQQVNTDNKDNKDNNVNKWELIKDKLINRQTNWFEKLATDNNIPVDSVRKLLLKFIENMEADDNIYNPLTEYLSYFRNWLPKNKELETESRTEKVKRETEQLFKKLEENEKRLNNV